MKIKEKGLSGKAAGLRRESMRNSNRTGFNAFREMGKASGDKGKNKDKPKPEVWLEFLGSKIRVHEEDGGTLKEEDIPFLRGATLKFDGVEGDVNFEEIKVRFCFVCDGNLHRLTLLCLGSSQRAVLSSALCQTL